MTVNEQLITNAYIAFNARDIDTILLLMHENVKWPRAWEGDFAIGHNEVRNYWERQWKEIDPKVTPLAFKQIEGDTLEVEVDQLVKDLKGNILFNGKVMHLYTISNGLIEKMEIKL